MPTFVPPGLGWHRDLPDWRDYGSNHDEVVAILAGLRDRGSVRGNPPVSVDWSEYFPPVSSQRGLQASTAHAIVGLVAYFERRAYARLFEGSSLFLYKMTRLLLQWTGDSGATLRDTLKALIQFGLPPCRFWSVDLAHFDDQPSAHLFSYAREFQQLRYVRLDASGADRRATLMTIKRFLASGFPIALGFTVFDSLGEDPEIPFPSISDRAIGGQAMIAVGYDDRLGTRSGRGALRVRGSWGMKWGDNGYGWLPYGYFQEGLAADLWTILRPDWIELGDFVPFL